MKEAAKKYYIGIDIGGMTVKGIIMERDGSPLAQGSIATGSKDGGNAMCINIAALISKMADESKINLSEAVGVGVGCPGLIDSKNGTIVFAGNLGKSAGTEIGHTVIETNGYPCTCGRWGCFECYASATALMRKTKDAMEEDTGSEMWKTYTPQTVSGKTPFEYAETDIAAKQVVDWYVKHLACGITNLANVFRPQVVMLGGGVSEQGERLTVPVQRLVDKELFAGTDFAPVKVVKASLGSRAGAYGAAALWME